MQRLFLCCLFTCILAVSAFCQTELTKPNLGEPSKIAPLYFGPNAFPIPDMPDGTVSEDLRIEISGEHYAGFNGDKTNGVFAKIQVPLFTDRVNFTLWMPIVEYYTNTAESRAACRLPDTVPHSGHEFGDVYISTDIQVLKQKKYCPDLVIRAALKSASGGGFYNARYYDCPGYFFDATVAKSLTFKSDFWTELRLAASTGFLCWQTDNGRQNDAVMYGIQLKLKTKYFSLSETWGGYSGWERDGDRPMSLKTYLTMHFGDLEPFVLYQYGIQDYPFHQYRVGLAYKIDVLKKSR